MSVTDLSRVPACELVNELVGRGGVTKDMGPTQIVVIPAYGGAV